MARYGMLKDTVIAGSAEDIRGTHLSGANDEKLGKISDVIFDHSTADIRYIVVETGWLHTKKFLVPAEAIRVSSRHEDDFEANLTKQQIENFGAGNFTIDSSGELQVTASGTDLLLLAVSDRAINEVATLIARLFPNSRP